MPPDTKTMERDGAIRVGAWITATGGGGTWREYLVWLAAQWEIFRSDPLNGPHGLARDFDDWLIARSRHDLSSTPAVGPSRPSPERNTR